MPTNADLNSSESLLGGRDIFVRKYPLFTRGAFVLVCLLGPLYAFQAIRFAIEKGNPGLDSHAYWLAARGDLLYDKAAGQLDAYLYSPAFAAALRPLSMLEWPLFFTVWVLFEASVLVWLLKPLQVKWSIPLFLLCVPELVNGNIFILLAASAVIGLRKPALWSFPVLTKITTGVGLFWFVARGEWKRLFQGIGASVAIITVAYILQPAAWQAWVQFLFEHRDGTQDGRISFLLRCLAAVALVSIGARKQLPWLIAPAMVLAAPIFALPTLTLLMAIPRLTMPPHSDGSTRGVSGTERELTPKRRRTLGG
jgi:hypothetical protein